jgi:hypothetical protein
LAPARPRILLGFTIFTQSLRILVAVEHHTKIGWATSAIMAWNTLRAFYNRTTMHKRVTMTRRLHESKMEGDVTIAKHLDDVDELIAGLQTLGEPLDETRQLVILLRRMPTEYALICSIMENGKKSSLRCTTQLALATPCHPSHFRFDDETSSGNQK